MSPPARNLPFDLTALIGVLLLFIGPAASLLAGLDGFVAGTLGYAGIMLFAGGIAARYGFVEHPNRAVALLKNLAVSLAITSVFYGIFFLLYFI